MKRIKLLVLSILVPCLSIAQGMSDVQIDSLVERTLRAFQVPGIAVGIVKDGKLVHAKGYGVRSLANNLPIDANTLFGIASNSKAFTAVALGILADEGKLNLDSKVRDFIPEFKLYEPFVTEDFRIRDLLTHRCGLGLGAGDLMFFPDSAQFSVNDAIYNLRFLKPESPFRTKFQSNNLLTRLLCNRQKLFGINLRPKNLDSLTVAKRSVLKRLRKLLDKPCVLWH